jgi:hypothetical protein
MKRQVNIAVPKYTADRLEKIASANGVHVCNVLHDIINDIDGRKRFKKVKFGLLEELHYVSMALLPDKHASMKQLSARNCVSIADIVKCELMDRGLIKDAIVR